MSRGKGISRRGFLRGATGVAAGAVGFPYVVSSSALGNAGSVAASERLVVGSVGLGPQGTGVMGNFLGQNDTRVVAVCDLKRQARENARNIINKHYGNEDCKMYTDFR